MEKPSITVRRIGGYVFVISMLLLGSVMFVWWALSGQMASYRSDTTSLVSNLAPGLTEVTTTTTSQKTLSVTSQQILDGAVGGRDIAKGAIEKEKLNTSLISWLEGLAPLDLDLEELALVLEGIIGLPVSDITSLQIMDSTIETVDLGSAIADSLALIGTVPDNSVTSLKIVDGAVELADLDTGITDSLALIGTVADNSVTSAKIVDGAVEAADIAAGIVTSALIADGTIQSEDLVLEIIDGTLLAVGSVDTDHIVDDSISGIKVLDGSIDSPDIADGAIGTTQIAADSIIGSLIYDGTITAADITVGTITSLLLEDGAVTSSKIFDGTIIGGDLADGAVGTTQLSNSSVQTGKLSTAANRRVVCVQIGDISAVAGDSERPVFVAPSNGAITKVTFTNTLAIAAGLNKGVLSVERKTATAATVASVDLGTVSMSAYVPQSPSLGGGTAFSTGDVYSFKWDAGLIGVALTGFLVTIEYLPSE